MPEWLSDWGFWGVVLAVLGLIAAIAVPYWLYQRSRKRLGFEVVINDPLVSSSAINRQEWEIKYRDERLDDPYVLVFQMENTGGVAIRPEDYESGRPITIASGNDAEFVAISKTLSYFQRLSLDTELTQHEVRINPMLINPSEGFYLTVVTEGKCEPKPSARIAGLEPDFKDIPVKSWWLVPLQTALQMAVLAVVLSLVGFGMFVYFYLANGEAPSWVARLSAAMTIVAVGFLVGAVVIGVVRNLAWSRRAKS